MVSCARAEHSYSDMEQLDYYKMSIEHDLPHILLYLTVLSEVMMCAESVAETDLTGLAPLPEAKGLPVGSRVLVDHHQQLTLSCHISIHVHLCSRTHYCVKASADIAACPGTPQLSAVETAELCTRTLLC